MTESNGQEITYDEIGNPLSYRDGIAMTWKNGRQLDTFTNGTNNVSYSYDSNSEVKNMKLSLDMLGKNACCQRMILSNAEHNFPMRKSKQLNPILYNFMSGKVKKNEN